MQQIAGLTSRLANKESVLTEQPRLPAELLSRLPLPPQKQWQQPAQQRFARRVGALCARPADDTRPAVSLAA